MGFTRFPVEKMVLKFFHPKNLCFFFSLPAVAITDKHPKQTKKLGKVGETHGGMSFQAKTL